MDWLNDDVTWKGLLIFIPVMTVVAFLIGDVVGRIYNWWHGWGFWSW